MGSEIDSRSADFIANSEQMRDRVENLRAPQAKIAEGGGRRAEKRHFDRGKTLTSEQVRQLLDPGSPFLELSVAAALGVYEDEVPAAGIITGTGHLERSAPLIRLEAITMEHTFSVRADGKISQLRAQPGQQVEEGQELLIIDS